MLVIWGFISQRYSSSSGSYLLRYQSQFLSGVNSHQSQEILIEKEISKVVLDYLEKDVFWQSMFSLFHLHQRILLLDEEWMDGVAMNPRSSQQ